MTFHHDDDGKAFPELEDKFSNWIAKVRHYNSILNFFAEDNSELILTCMIVAVVTSGLSWVIGPIFAFLIGMIIVGLRLIKDDKPEP